MASQKTAISTKQCTPRKRKPAITTDIPLERKVFLTIEETASLMSMSRDRVIDLYMGINPETGRPWLHSVLIKKARRIPYDSILAFKDLCMSREVIE